MSGEIIPRIEFENEKPKQKKADENNMFSKPLIALMVIASIIILINIYQVNAITALAGLSSGGGSSRLNEFSNVNISDIHSTAQTIAALFPISQMKTEQDAMKYMFPTGTPSYGAALGVSFDDPVNSLSRLQNMFETINSQVKSQDPQVYQR